MALKHLRELLSEDQEPFLLHGYITSEKSQLSCPAKARKLIKLPPRSPSNFAGSFCKNVCLFSVLPDSPDPRKSPLLDFATASPHRGLNRIFLQVPAKTAAPLLEAAVRIQQKRASPVKQKPARKGLFGSILKRLIRRKRAAPAREIVSELRRSFGGSRGVTPMSELKSAEQRSAPPCGCRIHSRRNSGLWSESNGERSLDLETSTRGSDSVELVTEEEEVYAAFDESPPGSPFRFVLRRSPSSSGERTPEFASPAASPARAGKEEIDHHDVGCSKELNSGEGEEEEREQCSPVSVLDPPFEDGHDPGPEGEGDGGFDYECSLANVQRAKQQLLEKLCRFEKLAGLDPVELEKRMLGLDGDDDEEHSHMSTAWGSADDEGSRRGQLITEVLKSRLDGVKEIPDDVRRLVSDLVAEEQGRQNEPGVTLRRRVCERFESWERVDSDTIDMVVEEGFGRELDGWTWKQHPDQVEEFAIGIEFAVCGILVEELLEDLF